MKKRKKKARNSNGVVTIKKGGLKKGHILFSECQIRVNKECILGFWAALNALVMSICPNFAPIVRFEHFVMVAFSFWCCE